MSCTTGVDWLYKLDASYTWDSGHPIPEDLVFRDKDGMVRLVIEKSGEITVTRDYAWNGASPKICLADLMLGTPEGVVFKDTGRPKTYYASLVHDALYQFLRDGLPLKRYHADAFFRRLLQESDFAPAWLYWLAVRLFGWLFWGGTKIKRRWRGRCDEVPELLSSLPGGSGTA